MVRADDDDIKKEDVVLINEDGQVNPELLDKRRILAITKSDMLDQELMDEIEKDLPEIPYVFISSVTNTGITELKDKLWEELNCEDNKITTITHRNLDIKVEKTEDDWEVDYQDDDEEEDFEIYEYDDEDIEYVDEDDIIDCEDEDEETNK